MIWHQITLLLGWLAEPQCCDELELHTIEHHE
ncbi:hypothetical protein R615_12675 [Thalassolituus oleivorans R6-15]|jgi:hypothetical protein|uniref:Uncharacterized protein n=1 Tax=Thalassolituus oleivorans MIL-1 TaxID=1298593 RepID=M5DPG5_9GAMM|nr:hypothetical protein R615_12675 [Thalassolituus oleivorans R6-15]CCU71378.1 hypothetical protein TOL_0942 [Thalassolituus oleivorans MIL-1]